MLDDRVTAITLNDKLAVAKSAAGAEPFAKLTQQQLNFDLVGLQIADNARPLSTAAFTTKTGVLIKRHV
jgi:hypothetical protein